MFNRKPTTASYPWEQSHHFHVGAYIYRDGMHVGCAQLWAESENELYAVLEVEGWEENPDRYRDIICTEYLDGQIVRQWTLEEV